MPAKTYHDEKILNKLWCKLVKVEPSSFSAKIK